jgi:hypothetical protein
MQLTLSHFDPPSRFLKNLGQRACLPWVQQTWLAKPGDITEFLLMNIGKPIGHSRLGHGRPIKASAIMPRKFDASIAVSCLVLQKRFNRNKLYRAQNPLNSAAGVSPGQGLSLVHWQANSLAP